MNLLNKQDFLTKIFNYEKNTEWKFEGAKPAIVDFYAEWCGPCKMLTPVLEQISKEYDGLVDVYKINVDTEPELADAFGVSSVPTVLFIPVEGQPRATQGAMPAQGIKSVIEDIFKIKKSA
jgi:thioredoxin 1